MKFIVCGCGLQHYHRVPRKWWMRLVPSRRLYRCDSCHALVFARYRG